MEGTIRNRNKEWKTTLSSSLTTFSYAALTLQTETAQRQGLADCRQRGSCFCCCSSWRTAALAEILHRSLGAVTQLFCQPSNSIKHTEKNSLMFVSYDTTSISPGATVLQQIFEQTAYWLSKVRGGRREERWTNTYSELPALVQTIHSVIRQNWTYLTHWAHGAWEKAEKRPREACLAGRGGR